MAAGIYIHIPFCVQKCLYCDFVSGCGTKDEMKLYQKALLNEIESTVIPETVDSVFFGGGTPSVYPVEYIDEILELLKQKGVYDEFDSESVRSASASDIACNIKKTDIEITMEVNPGTINRDKLEYYRGIGINRLSIGLQSANDIELKILGRIHDYEQFLESYQNAREAGFANINIDLMSAIPKQTISSYQDTLLKVLALKPEHISAYSLIVEEGTPFYEKYRNGGSNECDLPDEDSEREMYYLTKKELERHGYYRYEISNYAKAGYECKHNMKYWSRDNYYGFGAAASSLVDNIRYTNVKNRDEYRKANGDISIIREEILELSRNEQMEEFMFLGLRKAKGILLTEFEQNFNLRMQCIYGEKIEKLKVNGLLKQEGNRLFLTDHGIDISNMVLAEFLISE